MEDIAGRYEILDKDNKFIFGKLYRARDLEEDTIVFIQLIKDNIVEAIYCKDLRQTALIDTSFENINKINDINEIDLSPNDWSLCEQEKYKNISPWATIKHYFLVLTKGYIPSEYIKLEIDNSSLR